MPNTVLAERPAGSAPAIRPAYALQCRAFALLAIANPSMESEFARVDYHGLVASYLAGYRAEGMRPETAGARAGRIISRLRAGASDDGGTAPAARPSLLLLAGAR